MCSYCGCRNIPMIAKLSKEHEDIAACAYLLTAAHRDGDVEAGRAAARELAGKLHPHARREENGLFPSALAYLSDDQWETIHSPTLMQD